ncbi:hypothetical protein [Nocardia sp. NPDC049707]|uniref:hypothetical protein n=1 Tax=Nocardia sp. NPDC049707 TaxID=3154735 RepID=UPI003411FAAD
MTSTTDDDGFVDTIDIVYHQVVDSRRTARTILAERLIDSPLTALQDVAPHFLGLAGYFSRGDFGDGSANVRSSADSAANALVRCSCGTTDDSAEVERVIALSIGRRRVTERPVCGMSGWFGST